MLIRWRCSIKYQNAWKLSPKSKLTLSNCLFCQIPKRYIIYYHKVQQQINMIIKNYRSSPPLIFCVERKKHSYVRLIISFCPVFGFFSIYVNKKIQYNFLDRRIFILSCFLKSEAKKVPKSQNGEESFKKKICLCIQIIFDEDQDIVVI